jgi:hypothetical protein
MQPSIRNNLKIIFQNFKNEKEQVYVINDIYYKRANLNAKNIMIYRLHKMIKV